MGKAKVKSRKKVEIAEVLKVQAFLQAQEEPLTIEEIASKMAEAAGLADDYEARVNSYIQGIRRECERLVDANSADKERRGRQVVYSILTPEQAKVKAAAEAAVQAKQEKISESLTTLGFDAEEQQAILDQNAVNMNFDQFLKVLAN